MVLNACKDAIQNLMQHIIHAQSAHFAVEAENAAGSSGCSC